MVWRLRFKRYGFEYVARVAQGLDGQWHGSIYSDVGSPHAKVTLKTAKHVMAWIEQWLDARKDY